MAGNHSVDLDLHVVAFTESICESIVVRFQKNKLDKSSPFLHIQNEEDDDNDNEENETEEDLKAKAARISQTRVRACLDSSFVRTLAPGKKFYLLGIKFGSHFDTPGIDS